MIYNVYQNDIILVHWIEQYVISGLIYLIYNLDVYRPICSISFLDGFHWNNVEHHRRTRGLGSIRIT